MGAIRAFRRSAQKHLGIPLRKAAPTAKTTREVVNRMFADAAQRPFSTKEKETAAKRATKPGVVAAIIGGMAGWLSSTFSKKV